MANHPVITRPTWDHKSTARSRVTNQSDHAGRMILPDIDGRRLVARRFRDIASAVARDLGGVDQLTEVKKQLIRRFAAAAVVAENRETALCKGEDIDLRRYGTLCNTIVRLAHKLGMDRVPRDITDSLTLQDILTEGRRE
jgi:hypothetical protein